MDTPEQSSLTAISIGPGIRGIERGVERVVRLEHLAYVEIEAFIVENLVTQMERGILAPAPIWSDAKTLPCFPFRGLVDIILAGYPCQPFSSAGKRKGLDDPRHLYPYIERAIDIIRPRMCFFENVRGHVTCGLPEVIESLEGLGYRVHWGIFSAEETGAAHKRERVFILAILADANIDANRTGPNDIFKTCATTKGKAQREERHEEKRKRSGTNTGKFCEVDDADCQRCDKERERSNRFNKHCKSQDERGCCCEHNPDSKKPLTVVHASNCCPIHNYNPWKCRELADGDEQRLQSGVCGKFKRTRKEEESSEGCESSGVHAKTIARPGQPQHEWEHPRTIDKATESTLGLSAHGYNFREDVLRALGNSVYSDTAELAFRTLLKKHCFSTMT